MSEKNEWKPIASAPKDGTRVLLWNEKFTAPCSGQFYGFDDWKMDSDIPPFAFQPTHWMPLPPAPTSHPIPTGATGEDGRKAFEKWFDRRGVWPALCYEEVFIAGWNARPVDAPAAGDAWAEAVPDWMACESRRPWVTNGLKAYAQELRDKERRCRTAYNKDFYGIPARYIADACADAAAVFEAKLAAIAQQKGEA